MDSVQPKTCSVDGCRRPWFCREWCATHYGRMRAHGGLDVLPRTGRPPKAHAAKPGCVVPGCESARIARGMCVTHYKRVKKHGDPLVGGRSHPLPQGSRVRCSVAGCRKRASKAAGICPAHLQSPGRRATCVVGGCDSPIAARGLCRTHWEIDKAGGDPSGHTVRRRAPNGAGHTNSKGYRVVQIVRADGKMVGVLEHRKVMSEILGRPLKRHEDVHHKNGEKHRNEPTNLELWSTRHPKGQRVEDKVAFALELLTLYAPQFLALGVTPESALSITPPT